MTVSYSLNVSKATFGGFARLLFRWKGSIFKSLWRESLLFCTFYVLINATYRNVLDHQQQTIFAEVVEFGKYFMDIIPFSFIVGFYVTTVTGRWMNQFIELPWPDRTILTVGSFVHGSDDRSRIIRRTLVRYAFLMQVLTYQTVSTAVRRRFPTTQHLVAAGIMTPEERSVYEKIDFPFGKWWVPSHWFTSLATRAKKEGRIKDSILLKALFEEIFSLRTSCATMIGYDWIGVPLAYTQVATIATYLYALLLLIGTQSIETPQNLSGFTADFYFPFVTIWRFFFSVGWLKVAEQLLNPYGEDDDDFELNWSFDRALNMAYHVADTHHMMHPKVKKDTFWDVDDIRLPQTIHSAKYLKNPELGSAIGMEIEEADYLPMELLCETDDENNIYKNQSIKQGASRQNSSFIRRILSSRFSQSIQRKSRKNPAFGRSISCKQGFNNEAFSMKDEVIPSTQSTPHGGRKMNHSNLVKKSSSNQRNSSNLKPNNLVVSKQPSFYLEEPEMDDASSIVVADDGMEEPREKGRISRNCSMSPTTLDCLEADEREETDDDIEGTLEGDDGAMPPIPEEASRANSVDSNNIISDSGDQPRDLVTEVNKKLMQLHSMSEEEENGKSSKGYVSCCSDSEDISEDTKDDSEDVARTPKNDAVCVTIEQEQNHQGDVKCALQSDEPSKYTV